MPGPSSGSLQVNGLDSGGATGDSGMTGGGGRTGTGGALDWLLVLRGTSAITGTNTPSSAISPGSPWNQTRVSKWYTYIITECSP